MTREELVQKIRAKGLAMPQKPTRVEMIEGWVKLNELMAKPDKYGSKTYPDGLIKFDVKECEQCHKVDIVQHQGYCVECMADHAYFDDLIDVALSGECGMCGKVLKTNEQNPCKRCCREALGDNEKDREANIQSVIEHCQEITKSNA